MLKNNQYLLEESIKREENLQVKYKSEIMTAIKLNKDLNELVSKKNNEISELSLISKKKEIQNNQDISNLQKQTNQTHIEYSKYLSLQDKALKNLSKKKEEIEKITSNKLEELEEQKAKQEYFSQLLEEENKAMVFELKQTLKKMNENPNSSLNKS